MNASEETRRKIEAFEKLCRIEPDAFFGSGITISINTLDEEREIIPPVAINGEDFPQIHRALQQALTEGLKLRKEMLQSDLRQIESLLD